MTSPDTLYDQAHDPQMHAQVHADIDAALDAQETRKAKFQPQWIAHEICRAHCEGLLDEPTNPHVRFWVYTGYTLTRRFVTECINRRLNPVLPADQAATVRHTQPLLPYDGFPREYLQNYYVVRRDGGDVGVPTRDLTDAELDDKVDLFMGQMRQLSAHANELVRYKEWRHRQRSREAS